MLLPAQPCWFGPFSKVHHSCLLDSNFIALLHTWIFQCSLNNAACIRIRLSCTNCYSPPEAWCLLPLPLPSCLCHWRYRVFFRFAPFLAGAQDRPKAMGWVPWSPPDVWPTICWPVSASKSWPQVQASDCRCSLKRKHHDELNWDSLRSCGDVPIVSNSRFVMICQCDVLRKLQLLFQTSKLPNPSDFDRSNSLDPWACRWATNSWSKLGQIRDALFFF